MDREDLPANTLKEGDAVEIYIATEGNTIDRKIFSGEIEEVSTPREDGEPYFDIIAYDWSKLLSEYKINLSYPVVTNASTIVKEIVEPITCSSIPLPNERKISVNNVETVQKTRTIDFIGISMFEALKKLSDCTGCDFYVDPDKDLHWFLRGSRDSGKTLNENDLVNYEYKIDRNVVNHAIVYGAANRTYPKYDLDALSDSKDGWGPQTEEMPINTITVTPSSMSFGNQWDTYKLPTPTEMEVETFVYQEKSLSTMGDSPWLHSKGSDYVKLTSKGTISYFTLSDPTEVEEGKVWEEINLVLEGIHVFEQQYYEAYSGWSDKGDWDAVEGTILFDQSAHGKDHLGKCLMGGSYSYGYLRKDWTTDTRCVHVEGNLWLPESDNYTANDWIELVKIIGTNNRVLCQMRIEFTGSMWYMTLFGWDKNGTKWELNTGSWATERWINFKIDLAHVGSEDASVNWQVQIEDWDFWISESKTGIDLRDHEINEVKVGADYNTANTPSDWIYWSVVYLHRSHTPITVKAEGYKDSLGDWVLLGQFTVKDYSSWSSTIDIKSLFSNYSDLEKFKLRIGVPFEGCRDFRLDYAKITIKAQCYPDGYSFVDVMDEDQSYLQAGTIDKITGPLWKWDIPWEEAIDVESCTFRIYAKVPNGGTGKIRLWIKDASTGTWIDLGIKNITQTSYTSLTTWDASSYINQPYLAENVEVKLECEADVLVRVTYLDMKLVYRKATILLEEDSKKVKSGEKSLVFSRGGGHGSGTIELICWRTLPEVVQCQTTSHKEGFTKLAFAAYIDLLVGGEGDFYKRPEAVLDEFTVFLYDTQNHVAKYSAGDLYPVNTFTAAPRPEETKLKEIKIEVGQNAEADGKWIIGYKSNGTFIEDPSVQFDWGITKVEFYLKGTTIVGGETNAYLAYAYLWLDWLHFEEGRWYGEYKLPDDNTYVQKYGRCYAEFFDDTAFSTEDCYIRAKYYVEKYKQPLEYLSNVEIDYLGMENLDPGEVVSFSLPEGTFHMRITKIKWEWDGDLIGYLELDTDPLSDEVWLERE
ncbi:MAG: hypothetical protein DRJ03_23460 [Chloroflexi bacterium]|nr:MAG: hypothetical protein DRJ03_23460 [Chloroflexota bacterium]